MNFSKDDLRAAYSQGFDDGVFSEIKGGLFNEAEFDLWFEFVFKDRLEEEKAYIETMSFVTNPPKEVYPE